jgi:hypothetical protein
MGSALVHEMSDEQEQTPDGFAKHGISPMGETSPANTKLSAQESVL